MEDSWEMIVDPASQLSALAVSSYLIVDQRDLVTGNEWIRFTKKIEAGSLQMCSLKASACLSCDDDDDDDGDIYKKQCVSGKVLVFASDGIFGAS